MNASRPECRDRGDSAAIAARHDTVVEIAKIQVSHGCLFGRMNYQIGVEWRAIKLRTGKELCSTATRCTVTSSRDVDAWFADRYGAQGEIESALAAIGRRIALQMLTQDPLRAECQLQSNETGEVTPR